MKCATVGCEAEAVSRVYWPGQTRDMCAPCALRAAIIANNSGFALKIGPISTTDTEEETP